MEPIINPWIVYVINTIENLNPIMWVVFLALAVVFTASVIYLITAKDDILNYRERCLDYDYKVNEKKLNILQQKKDNSIRIMKKTVILFIIVMIIYIFIPSRETMYAMFTLNYVTEDNIKVVGDSAQDVVDYIFDKVEEITDNDTGDGVVKNTENESSGNK